MAVFEYKGLDKSGRFLKDFVEAENIKTAKQILKKKGIYLQEIEIQTHYKKDSGSLFQSQKVNTKELAVFTRLLASLLRAGVPLVEALDAISQQMPNPYFCSSVANLKDQVNEGKPFYIALKEYPLIFDLIYVSLCESGEASGTLDNILEQIADLMEKRASVKNKVLTALFYPMILFVIAITVMIVLCVYVIPNLMELFENVEDLPWMTKVTLALSNFLINYWIVLIVSFFTGLYLFLKWKKTKRGKSLWDKLILSIPVFGRLIRTADIAMFSKTLSVLLKGGVPVLKSMDIVKNVLSNNLIKQAVERARENIKEGEPIVEPLMRSGQFPPVVLQMIRVGEKTGELENMLDQVGQSYDRQVEMEVSALTALLGPIMILFMAGIIVFILLSALLPMLGSFDALSG
ncbi:MAG: type II secretion system F family protein [Bdellovibrionaceae bacterium]|nr:type II secretion system F family protein [Pseudobdellovibrionaceae bacterium]